MSYSEIVNNINKLTFLVNHLENRRNTGKIHLKINKLLRKIKKHLETIRDIFWNEKTKLSIRNKIINQYENYLDLIASEIITLYRHNVIKVELVIDFARLIANFGKFDAVENMLNNTLGLEETYPNLATLSDIFFEVGMLDKSLEVMKRLEKIGVKFFETYYNSILILYFMGKDLEAIEMLNEVNKKFGSVPQITGLKIALCISNNDIAEANEINKKRRGLI